MANMTEQEDSVVDSLSREVATWRDEQGSKGERFGYNAIGQLTSATYNADQVWTGNPLNWDRPIDYTYSSDKLNRQSMTDNGVVTSYGANAMNQITLWGGQSVLYDGNFNFSWMGGWQYTYDAERRLTALGNPRPQAQFVYDGLGRCVKRIINGVSTVINY